MAFIGLDPKQNTTTLTPQAADPSSPSDGMLYISNGTPRAEGLWRYDASATSWIRLETTVDSITNITGNYTLLATDQVITADTSGGNITITLPAASGNVGLKTRIVKTSASNILTITRAGADLINAKTSIRMINLYETIEIQVISSSQWLVQGINPGERNEVRLNTGNGNGSTATRICRFTTTEVNTGGAITYADSATNGGSFTINQDGLYGIDYSEVAAAGGAEYGFSRNSAQLTTNITGITANTRLGVDQFYTAAAHATCSVSGVYLVVGDVIRAHTDGGNASGNTRTAFRILQLQKVY